jgi:hypothetical protein
MQALHQGMESIYVHRNIGMQALHARKGINLNIVIQQTHLDFMCLLQEYMVADLK